MYIGIIGYKGDDKNKIAHLIGETLNWMLDFKKSGSNILDKECVPLEYMRDYCNWCDTIENKKKFNSLDKVYYASFSYPLKMIISLMTSIPFDILNNSEARHNYIINVNTLDYKKQEDEKLISPEKLFRKCNRNTAFDYNDNIELPNVWMSLNDYVIYFGYYLCRNYIGKDIWTHVEKTNNKKLPYNEFNPLSYIRIYSDIRNIKEYEYIKDMGGIIIRMNQNKDDNSIVYDNMLSTVDVDIEIGWFSDIRGIYKDIWMYCTKILSGFE